MKREIGFPGEVDGLRVKRGCCGSACTCTLCVCVVSSGLLCVIMYVRPS